MKELLVGIDLHSNNHVVGIQDCTDRRIKHKRLENRLPLLLNFLEPFKEHIREIAVESTFNWYWIVDGLMDSGYKVNLVHPPKVTPYKGLKHTDDKHDAFFLAHLMRLGILPTGYIYPRELRGVRDLNRKCRRFIDDRTRHILSLKSFINRHLGDNLSGYKIKTLTEEEIAVMFSDTNLKTIGLVDIHTIQYLNNIIKMLEKKVLEQVTLREDFARLLTIPGVGKTLAVTISLEVGDIKRFPSPGDYISYCRQVKSKRESNNKIKGSNNKKNGNTYLAWVYMEAACKAARYSKRAKAYFDRKKRLDHIMVAYKSLAAKIARASYYMMRDNVDYNEDLIFPKPYVKKGCDRKPEMGLATEPCAPIGNAVATTLSLQEDYNLEYQE
jgi:transposase